ncbi:hypothetical protein IT571_07540 [Candidatus Sumerlaeota bacterium]|nr:hypothetical protein [Candidatus Sumerlaeota bacterium]
MTYRLPGSKVSSMKNGSLNRRRGAISTEYVVALVLIAVASILAFMYLAFAGRSQSKSVVTKIAGEVKTTQKVAMVDTDPLIEQRNSMDQSGQGTGELEFDSGGSSSRSGSTAVASARGGSAASRGGSGGTSAARSGSGSSSSSGRGGSAQNASGSSGGGGEGASARSSGSVRRGGEGGGSGFQSKGVSGGELATGKKQEVPLIWVILGLAIVFGVFFLVMYIGRGS